MYNLISSLESLGFLSCSTGEQPREEGVGVLRGVVSFNVFSWTPSDSLLLFSQSSFDKWTREGVGLVREVVSTTRTSGMRTLVVSEVG